MTSTSSPQSGAAFQSQAGSQAGSQAESQAGSQAGSQSISMNIGSNSGAVQAVNAGRDAVVSQALGAGSATAELSQAEAVALLDEILGLIRAAGLPEADQKKVEMYAELAKGEASGAEPNKKMVIGNLEGATGLLKRLGETATAGKALVEQLRGPVSKLAGWLGVAAVHFLG